jgi:hypothetical protein
MFGLSLASFSFSLTGKPRRSRKSGADNDSKRSQTVTRVPRVTNYWPGLKSVLATLWVAVLRQLKLVPPRLEGSGLVRFLRGSDRPGSSRIRYRSASPAAMCRPLRLAPWSGCSGRLEHRSRTHLRRNSEHKVRSCHGVDPPSDISFLTGALRQKWRCVRLLV